MAIVIKARAMHARGMKVSGGITGREYHVDADTGHLRMIRDGSVGEVDVHPDDARELLQFTRDYQMVEGEVPSAPPPPPPKAPEAAQSEPAPAEDPPAEEPKTEEPAAPPPPPPPVKKPKVIALPADDVWTVAEWSDAAKTGVELTDEEKATRPKAKLVALVREKAKAARHS